MNSLADFLNTISEEDYLEYDSDVFEYEGFNPEAFFMILKKKNDDAKGSNNGLFKKDMIMLTALTITRGTNISKILNKSGDEAVKKIKDLKNKYGIVDTTKIKVIKRTSVIMSRFPATFPEVAFELLEKGKVPVRSKKEGLRDGLHFSGAAALIPAGSKVFDTWLEWAIEFDKLINPDNHDSEKVKNFAQIAHRSGNISNADRQMYE